ncbi:MAG: cytochrome c [Gallionellaceae bacterium]|jgi:cbb3-type cytochrome oxidase cytochrome c subunit|nr:cytochrome c [Gallionellaceae bacterium]
MKRGEKVVLVAIALIVVGLMVLNYSRSAREEPDKGIPYYSIASEELKRAGWDIYRQQNCKACHSLLTLRDMTQRVPAPALDGIGSLRTEDWLYQYFSAPNPQEILPSRLNPEYRMPSYVSLPEQDRRTLAAYMASLKVEDWYLEDTRKAIDEAWTTCARTQSCSMFWDDTSKAEDEKAAGKESRP